MKTGPWIGRWNETRKRIIIPGILLISFALLSLTSFFILGAPGDLPLPVRKNTSGFRLVAANLNYMNGRAGEVSETLLRLDFDIAVITEWTGKNAFRDRLEMAGYQIALDYPLEGTHGLCVVAKPPLRAESRILGSPVKSPCRMPFAITRVFSDRKYTTIIGAHTPPPVSACQDANRPTLKAMAGWIENGILKKDLPPGVKGDRVIIAGDLNEFSPSRSLARFSRAGMTDAFEKGWKPAPTWSPIGFIPAFVRIDHILVGKGLGIEGAHVVKMSGSDHHGIVADISILGP